MRSTHAGHRLGATQPDGAAHAEAPHLVARRDHHTREHRDEVTARDQFITTDNACSATATPGLKL